MNDIFRKEAGHISSILFLPKFHVSMKVDGPFFPLDCGSRAVTRKND